MATEVRFIDGERRLAFGLGQIVDQLAERGVAPSEVAIDLALVAATITAADTRISRGSDSQDSWTREIDLYVPVYDAALWNGAARLIARAMAFLTGDRWRLFFRPRHRDYRELRPRPASRRGADLTSVCLFSGGLDSFVGAIDLLQAGEKPIFVSHYWDLSTSSQGVCARRIGGIYGDMNPRHVRARVGFPDDLIAGSMPEATQRGRSFLFFALAALAASALERETTIYVPENGLISLNVPLDPLRVGAWSTRTTHPFYMARWQELLRALAIPAAIVNPYRFSTKGEVLSRCANQQLLRKGVAETISCSSVGKARWKGQPPGHCGYCTPCLIRRAAIKRALGADPTPYTIPRLTAQTLNSASPEGEHVRSFQLMAARLAKAPGLARFLIYKAGPLRDYPDSDIEDYVGVFSRGIAEVASLLRGVKTSPL